MRGQPPCLLLACRKELCRNGNRSESLAGSLARRPRTGPPGRGATDYKITSHRHSVKGDVEAAGGRRRLTSRTFESPCDDAPMLTLCNTE
jgi:hypothetical protein